MADFIQLFVALLIFLAGAYYLVRRAERMKAVLREPETEEERRLRHQIPAAVRRETPRELLANLREALVNADHYLESAESAQGRARRWSGFDILDLNPDAGGGGMKEDAVASLLGDLSQADAFLAEARHRMRRLHEDVRFASAVSASEIDIGLFDWVLDNPLSDLATYRRLGRIGSRIGRLRRGVAEALKTLPELETRVTSGRQAKEHDVGAGSRCS